MVDVKYSVPGRGAHSVQDWVRGVESPVGQGVGQKTGQAQQGELEVKCFRVFVNYV